MAKTELEREAGGGSTPFFHGNTVQYRAFFEQLRERMNVDAAWIVSAVPRGGLQLLQPVDVNETISKAYLHDLHREDVLSWQTIIRRTPLRLSDLPTADHFASRIRNLLGTESIAAAPLRAPLLPGFAGALNVMRADGAGDFTPEQMQVLLGLAREVERAIDSQRQSRKAERTQHPIDPSHRAIQRLFAFRSDGRSLLPDASISIFDSNLQHQITRHVREQMERMGKAIVQEERPMLPDEYGEHWTFRSTTYASYPALANSGPVMFLALEPSGPEWALLRADDFAADPEAVRLAPAMDFMLREFHRGPTLSEIARSVYLSPFHFHRRFSELFGITPKHFLLECQLHAAKIQLMTRETELLEIARECGFAHQSHFTSRFKQASGLTPTRWRRMVGERLKGSKF